MSCADTRTHLAITFDESAVGDVARVRHRYDPVMAAGVQHHVTVVYPEEYSDLELLMGRARDLAEQTPPFTFSGERFVTDSDEGQNGVFLELRDPSGSWLRLRSGLLAAPFRAQYVAPHLTIVHPRTSNLGPEAWADLRDKTMSCHLVADSLALTVTSDSNQRTTTDRIPLAGTGRHLCVGVIPVKDGCLPVSYTHLTLPTICSV